MISAKCKIDALKQPKDSRFFSRKQTANNFMKPYVLYFHFFKTIICLTTEENFWQVQLL